MVNCGDAAAAVVVMPGKSTNILLVEDNPGDARLVREMLAEFKDGDFEFHWVTSLSLAMDSLAAGGIDLVILDLGLPDSQGLETFTRAYKQASHLPFIVLTGYADETLGLAAVRQGAQEYLTKGEVNSSLLYRAIRYAIERKRSEAAIEAERQKFFTLLNNIPGIVHLKDADFKIVFANRLFREVFGDPADQPCYEFIHGKNAPCEHCTALEVLQTRVPKKAEGPEPVHGHIYEFYNYPYCATDGSRLVLTLGIDITERKRFEKQLIGKSQDLSERVKEITCLYSITSLMGEPNLSLENILQKVLELIPLAWKYPDITCARITFEGCTYRTAAFRETQWRQASDIMVNGDCRGSLEVFYLREKPVLDEGPFLKEERSLLESIAKTLGVITVHKRAQQELRESEENLRSLTSQLLTAQERERQRISRELHDSAAQELSAIKIGLENLQHDLPEKPVEVSSLRISQLLQKLQQTLTSIRTLSYDLRPPDLEHFGLVKAIEMHAEEFSARTGIKVDFLAAGIKTGHLDYDAAINLYRIIQEGLTNVWRHAKAMNVTIRLVASFPKIILRLEDDGQGFDIMDLEATRPGDKHMGLLGMRERVALLGGEIKIESQRTKGTKISIEIPWKGEDLGTKEEDSRC